ncbi:ATP-binding protein [candidate division KSB3 bacterium]|uniref:Iron-sulfur cluster carrier protein n=1 Tax=candidate division KSB3 bacterium TaxID=2044937 RepID=A0A2G6E6M2_9BACT|nr:MAG: ATP-binding protein [candidate division KSB3 bacterium]PIE29991.1 MAG: ATP-binding protein [candidate division KSB3 bacterium]
MQAHDQTHEQHARLQENLRHINKTIVIMSGKGGVGKSTVAANLAIALAKKDHTVGLMDADIHGPNIPKMLGIDGVKFMSDSQGIQPVAYSSKLTIASVAFFLDSTDEAVIWRGPLKHSLIRQFVGDVQWGKLDYLVIDLPPGTGDEPLSVAHTIPSISGAIIVTTPQDVALLDARKSVTFARKLNMPIGGILENMSRFCCPHCGESIDIFQHGGGERTANELNVPFLGRIPLDPLLVQKGDAGKPYVDAYPASEITAAFLNLAEQCEQW